MLLCTKPCFRCWRYTWRTRQAESLLSSLLSSLGSRLLSREGKTRVDMTNLKTSKHIYLRIRAMRKSNSISEQWLPLPATWWSLSPQSYLPYLLAQRVSLVGIFVPSRAKISCFSLEMEFRRPLWADIGVHHTPRGTGLTLCASRQKSRGIPNALETMLALWPQTKGELSKVIEWQRVLRGIIFSFNNKTFS